MSSSENSDINGIEFIQGRNIWIKTISKFINDKADKCNLEKLFKCEVITVESSSKSSINKCTYKELPIYVNSDMDIKPKEAETEEQKNFDPLSLTILLFYSPQRQKLNLEKIKEK